MDHAAFKPIEAWSKIQHPNIVPVREAFTTQAFNDNCEWEPAMTEENTLISI
jgi:hypothetical protein